MAKHHRGNKALAEKRIMIQKRRDRIRYDFLVLHIKNRRELAARYGVSEMTISTDMKAILEQIKVESDTEAHETRAICVEKLWKMNGLIMDDYMRSRQGEETVEYKEKRCEMCKGEGTVDGNGDACEGCNGSGWVTGDENRVRRVKRTPGDPRYPREVRGNMQEIAKLEGLYPEKGVGEGGGGGTNINLNQLNVLLSQASDADLRMLMDVYGRLGLTRQKVLEGKYNRVEDKQDE